MLTVHLLGHAHVTYNNRPVPLSAKAVALITYLTIEKLPQHRERLADLLWNTPEARKNLRVELARIRSAGLNLFPLSRQLLYLENVETDLNVWLAGLGADLDQAGLAQWLSTLRGVPLSGLEDLGSPAFQEWVDHQRWVLTEQTEEVLGRAYARFHHSGKEWATRAIAARAEALGFVHPGEMMEGGPPSRPAPPLPPSAAAPLLASPDANRAFGAERGQNDHLPQAGAQATAPASASADALDATLHFSAPDRETALRQSLRRAAQAPQVVVLHGPTGSGKSYGAERVLAGEHWLTLRVSNSRAGRLILATLAQSLLALPFLSPPDSAPSPDAGPEGAATPPSGAQTLQNVLLCPGSLEEDVVRVATVLATLPQPLAIVLDHAHNGPVELASLLEFMLNVPAAAPRALVMLSRTPPSQAPLCRALLRRFGAAQSLVLEVTPLSPGSVAQALRARGVQPAPGGPDLHAQAAVLLQRSGGNPLHLLALLDHAAQTPAGRPTEAGTGGRLPSAMRDTYQGEIDGWSAPLREALSNLSVIQGDFSFTLVGSLPESARAGLGPAALLREALERHALIEAEPPTVLTWPDLGPADVISREEPVYRFRSEGLRITLSGAVPQGERQALRRHLAGALEASQPGLALYYRQRAEDAQNAGRVRGAYQARLPAGSPLLAVPGGPAPMPVRQPAPTRQATPEPRRTQAGASAAVSSQGYLLVWEQGGWLSVLSQGRYGHPNTLRVQVPVPAGLRGAASLTVRLVWRLDVFHGGHELGPLQPSFPLRVCVPGADGARVLSPDTVGSYTEEGQRQQVHGDVTVGGWMQHELSFTLSGQPAERLELHVRALDLALTVGELSVNGQTLLPLAQSPERPETAPGRRATPTSRPAPVRR